MNTIQYVSECCYAPPATELDMSSIPYGGPSGFCGRCFDNCIFIVPCYNCGDASLLMKSDNEYYCNDCSIWIDSMGAIGVVRGDSDGKYKD